MTPDRSAALDPGRPGDPLATLPPQTLVWLDAREAVVARWRDGAISLDRIESDVPPHRRGTGRRSTTPEQTRL